MAAKAMLHLSPKQSFCAAIEASLYDPRVNGLVYFNIININMITFSGGGIVTPQAVKVLYPENGGPGF